MKTQSLLTLVVALAAVAGCKGAPVQIPDSSLATVTPLQSEAGVLSLAPTLQSAVSKDGLANLLVSMNVRETPSLGFRVLAPSAMPAAWNIAWISLHSPTVNAAYDANLHRRSLEKASFQENVTGEFTGRFTFPPLRPSSDYQARVFVGNDAGSTDELAGSLAQDNVQLKAGLNSLRFDVVVNSQEGGYSVSLGQSANVIGDGNSFTKDDVVTLRTGLMAKQPGVARLDVKLSGAAYGNAADDEAVLVKSFDATASDAWYEFVWDTSASQSAYVAETLVGGDEYASETAKLHFHAFNERGEQVGTAEMGIGVYGRPEVEVTLF